MTATAEAINAAARRAAKPTEAQAEAGVYRMGHIRIHGLDVTIETSRGRSRKPGWPAMACHYGYFKRTLGRDGDHVDVFIGPHPDSDLVVVVDQVDRAGKFDEHKALLAFRNKTDAIKCYRKCYTPGWKVGPVTTMTIGQFKNWLLAGDQRRQVSEQVSRYAAQWDASDHPRGTKGRFVTKISASFFDSMPGKNLRDKAYRWAKDNLFKKKVVNKETGLAISIGRTGINHALHHLPDERPLLCLQELPRLLQSGTNHRRVESRKIGDQNIKAFHYFDAPVIIEGEPHTLEMKIREDGMGHAFYDHHAIKKGPPRSAATKPEGNKPTQTGEPPSSIAPSDSGINRFSAAFTEAMADQYASTPNWDQRLAALQQRRDPERIERIAPGVSLREALAAAIAERVAPPAPTMAEQFSAMFANALAETYAARGPKNSPGQLDLFGGSKLRGTKTQQRLNWEESKHPRDTDGKFTDKGAGSDRTGGKKRKTPFVYPSGERQGFGDDGKPEGTPAEPPQDAPTPKPPVEEPHGGDDKPEAKPGDLFGDEGKADEGREDETPRERAERQKREDDPDYEFARKSTVPNAGEDLKGSARHNLNQWRSLEQAEEDGTAEAMVTRDQLLKNEPHEIGVHAHRDPLTALSMHLALKAFPTAPGSGVRYYRPDAEQAKKNRSDFVEAYRNLKKIAEEETAKGGEDPERSLQKFNRAVLAEVNRLREGDRYNSTANSLVKLYNQTRHTYRKAGIAGQVQDFKNLESQHHMDMAPDDRDEAKLEKVMTILEGKSINSTFGVKGKAKGGFDAASMYVAHASREGGPESPAKTAKDANDFLVSKAGFRGVQYGNSVSDKEREHHATMAAAAMVDLADITGLPVDAIGFGGKLGLAIGARGRANALAHYEPGSKVINLTRKKGVGSLAHEWAHALDHEMAGGEEPMMSSRGKMDVRYQSEDGGVTHTGKMVDGKWVSSKQDRTGEPKFKAMEALKSSMRESGYRERLPEAMKAAGIGGAKAQYWTSHREMFARCFERFAQRKLEKSGRKNTYLAGIESKAYKSGGLWPTDAEVDKMAPHFEKLLSAHRKDAHGLDDPIRYSAADRQFHIRRLADTILEVTAEADYWLGVAEQYRVGAGEKPPQAKTSKEPETVVGNFGDRGRFVTTEDGVVIFISNDGTVNRGPKELKGTKVDPRTARGRDRKPKSERNDRFAPKTQLDHSIVDAIGDHPDDVAAFRDYVNDAHSMLARESHETRDAMRQLLGQFGINGKQASGWLSSLKRVRDYDKIPHFDEMADYAQKHHPELLTARTGESDKSGDAEASLFARLKEGFPPPPAKHSPEVIELAMEMAGPAFLDGDDEAHGPQTVGKAVLANPDDPFSDFVPFAAGFTAAFIERYAAAEDG